MGSDIPSTLSSPGGDHLDGSLVAEPKQARRGDGGVQVLSYLTQHEDHYHRLFDILLDRISGLVEEKTVLIARVRELETAYGEKPTV